MKIRNLLNLLMMGLFLKNIDEGAAAPGLISGAPDAAPPAAGDPPAAPAAPAAGDPPAPPAAPAAGDPPAAPAAPAADSWINGLPPEYQTNPNITKYASQDELLKGHMNLVSLAGRKALERPAEDAAPEAWNEFYTRIGRPETPDEYDWKPTPPADLPEGIEVDLQMDPEAMKATNAKLHSLGLTKEQHSQVMDMYAADAAAQKLQALEAEQQEYKQVRNDAVLALQKDWGTAFNANIKNSNAALKAAGLDKAILDMKLENRVETYKLGLDLSRKLGEASLEAKGNHVPPLTRIDQIRQSEAYKQTTHPGHGKALDELNQAYKDAYPG